MRVVVGGEPSGMPLRARPPGAFPGRVPRGEGPRNASRGDPASFFIQFGLPLISRPVAATGEGIAVSDAAMSYHADVPPS